MQKNTYSASGAQPANTATYAPTAHDRILFKNGWQQFVSEHNLNADTLVLIMFHKMNNDDLQFSFDVVGICFQQVWSTLFAGNL